MIQGLPKKLHKNMVSWFTFKTPIVNWVAKLNPTHFCNSERRDEKCDFHLRVIFQKIGYKSKRKVKNYRVPPMLW
jgi:hypothetical protein